MKPIVGAAETGVRPVGVAGVLGTMLSTVTATGALVNGLPVASVMTTRTLKVPFRAVVSQLAVYGGELSVEIAAQPPPLERSNADGRRARAGIRRARGEPVDGTAQERRRRPEP